MNWLKSFLMFKSNFLLKMTGLEKLKMIKAEKELAKLKKAHEKRQIEEDKEAEARSQRLRKLDELTKMVEQENTTKHKIEMKKKDPVAKNKHPEFDNSEEEFLKVAQKDTNIDIKYAFPECIINLSIFFNVHEFIFFNSFSEL